ncbi:hypothetical protein ACGFI9_21220 [Micromonospora sp. NPDC048930]|uniref:hypothetical protein n=1 Tax=Micromonospora sp. NPDC048930 TaxID=3364261 RepID=UPI003710C11C
MSKVLLAATAALAVALPGSTAQASTAEAESVAGLIEPASLGTYGDYSRMFERSAGQFWSGSWRNQWAWEPQGLNVSHIRWGDPAAWPPANYERFERSLDGQWVLLDGYGDNTGFLPQQVTRELIGDVNCQNMTALPWDGGKQHYVKWNIQSTAYCLEAWGQILIPGGTPVDFYHKQVWFPPSPPTCNNMYYQNQTCIKQYEVWKDNNPGNGGVAGGPLELRHERDHILAKGLGPAYIIHNYFPNNGWQAELRYNWTY